MAVGYQNYVDVGLEAVLTAPLTDTARVRGLFSACGHEDPLL